MKSKPYGKVYVWVHASCKDGLKPEVKDPDGGPTNDKIYECRDNDDQSIVTRPLASIKSSGQNAFAQTLVFTTTNWNIPQEVEL